MLAVRQRLCTPPGGEPRGVYIYVCIFFPVNFQVCIDWDSSGSPKVTGSPSPICGKQPRQEEILTYSRSPRAVQRWCRSHCRKISWTQPAAAAICAHNTACKSALSVCGRFSNCEIWWVHQDTPGNCTSSDDISCNDAFMEQLHDAYNQLESSWPSTKEEQTQEGPAIHA